MEIEEKSVDEVKINYRGIKAMPYVIGNETFEKLGTTGTLANFLVYLTTVFRMKSITAANVVNIFNGTTNFATLIGAFLCDTYFGRYKTIAFASIASVMGMLVLTLTAAISKLHPPHCSAEDSNTCSGPNQWQLAFLVSGLGLLVVGGAGIRPCNMTFGADQFNPETESGKRGMTSFFNWYYFTFTFAMMVSLTIIVYIQSDVSWAWGLGIPALLMFLSCIVFFVGSGIYVKVKPEGSPLLRVVQVIVVSIKKRKLKSPEQPWISLYNNIPKSSINSMLHYTDQFRFLDKAAIITPEDKLTSEGYAVDTWKLCSLQQIEEVKCLIRVIPIWLSCVFYFISMVQQQTYPVFQALQSDRRLSKSFKIPAATYSIFTMIGLTIWIPVYDRIIVPRLRKLTRKDGGITILQKMGIGMVLSIATMIISGIVEAKRRSLALSNPIRSNSDNDGAISSMSAMWLTPQLILIGISEGFTVVGQIEFYYKQFPENMRSIGASLTFVGLAGSSYLSSLLISVVHQTTKKTAGGDWLSEDLNEGKLDYFYYLVAAIGVLNFVYFLACANWYKYKGNSRIALEVPMKSSPSETPII